MEYGSTFYGQRKSGSNASEIAQPFAGSPVSVIDSIVITKGGDTSAVLAQWIAYDPSISVHANMTSAQYVALFLNWSDRNGTVDLQQGDYFTFVIPDVFNYNYITNVANVPIRNEFGEVVATYSIYDNSSNQKEVRITFTDYVDTHTDISGDFWMHLYVGSVTSTQQQNLEFIINDVLVAEGVVTINPNTGTYNPVNQKFGYSSPTEIAGGYYIFSWVINFNMKAAPGGGFNRLENFSFEDIIPENSPHAFLTPQVRAELGISPTEYPTIIGEYVGADSIPPESRFQFFYNQYNSVGANSWYEFIDEWPLVNGLTTVGIDGGTGLNVSGLEITDKLLSANLGTISRPTVLTFSTISTIRLTESALGDPEVARLFQNTFRGSSGEDFSTSLTVYRFEAGGSAQGILGDYGFTFSKVDRDGAALPGAMFSLFTSTDFSAGADRFVFSADNGVVAFNHLPAGTYYLQETTSPVGYLPNNTTYRVVITSAGFEIYYGANFENRLSDIGNRIVNIPEFEIRPVSVILTGTKALTGAILTAGMFNFTVKDSEGNAVAVGTNDEDGTIRFSSIEFDEPGVFTFTVEELQGSSTGIIYDGSIFTVTVTVTEGEDGTLLADVAYPSGGIAFVNRFVSVTPVSVTLTGTKTLTGAPLTAGMFNFIVKDSGGNTVAVGTNDEEGTIQFGSIVFEEPGVFTFTVEEIRGSSSGIIYDSSVFTVTVTVTEGENRILIADVAYPSGGIAFVNRFVSVTPVSVTLTGTKTLTGATLTAGMFSFAVRDSGGNTVAVGTNDEDGTIRFDRIEFYEPGVYAFTVEEIQGSSGEIIYDGSVFTVTVTVTEGEDGTLLADVAYPPGGIAFVNRVVEKPPCCKPCCCVPCCDPCCNPCCEPCCNPCQKPCHCDRKL